MKISYEGPTAKVYTESQLLRMLEKATGNSSDFIEILKTEKAIELLTGEQLWQEMTKNANPYYYDGGFRHGAQYCINRIINKSNETL